MVVVHFENHVCERSYNGFKFKCSNMTVENITKSGITPKLGVVCKLYNQLQIAGKKSFHLIYNSYMHLLPWASLVREIT